MKKNAYLKVILYISAVLLIAATGCRKKRKEDPQPAPAVQIWRHYNVANSALPDQQINALAIDQLNTVWIGTANGLARFKNNEWIVFKAPLPSNFVQAITIEPNGVVWAGTNKGLARYDGSNWTVYQPENSALPDKAIMSLTYDAVNRLTWVGTAKGIAAINAAGNWDLHDEIAGELVLSMAADRDGALWLGTHEPTSFRGKIRRFYQGKWKSFQLDQMGFESAFPYAMGIDQNNHAIAILAGTAVRTALKLKGDSWTELTLPAQTFGVRALAISGEQLWVGGTSITRFDQPGNLPVSIPNNITGVLAMAADSKGALWLGTTRDGLSVYQP